MNTKIAAAFGLVLLANISPVFVYPAVAATGSAEIAESSYRVYYRATANDSWAVFGTYDSEQDAQDAVNLLKDQGYDAYYKAFSEE